MEGDGAVDTPVGVAEGSCEKTGGGPIVVVMRATPCFRVPRVFGTHALVRGPCRRKLTSKRTRADERAGSIMLSVCGSKLLRNAAEYATSSTAAAMGDAGCSNERKIPAVVGWGQGQQDICVESEWRIRQTIRCLCSIPLPVFTAIAERDRHRARGNDR